MSSFTRWLFAIIALFVAPLALAQEAPQQRLPLSAAMPLPLDGLYTASDDVAFTIDHWQGQTRLKFTAGNEVFYLTSEPAAMGARVFKYDTGDVVLMVAGWGGVTLYTPRAPAGVPAEHSSDTTNLYPGLLNGRQTKILAAQLSQQLQDRDNLSIGFAANWDRFAHIEAARALAVDAMRNTTEAIETLLAQRNMRQKLSKLRVVRIVESNAPAALLQNDTLIVSFVTRDWPRARPSSLMILKALRDKL